MNFRTMIFWLHLAAGLVAGAVIGLMSFTGAALAFEKEIIAWAERSVRHVTPPPAGARLSVDDLLARAQKDQPDLRPSTLILSSDPDAAVVLSLGRTNALYANPYTGETHVQTAGGLRQFMHVMVEWHRWLGRGPDGRAAGKAITGACNAAFLVLALSGLYLWWPRQWSATLLRAIALPNLRARGKARDFNWHNAIGLWTAPVLIVLTATALPISYRWAGDLVYKLTGTEPPPPGQGPGGPTPALALSQPAEGVKPLTKAALVAIAQKEVPAWQQITVRLGGGGPRSGGGGSDRKANPTAAAGEERRGPQPVSLTVKEKGGWPKFASIQLTLDPYTGEVLRREGFESFNTGRKVRSWTRFLHTGEALGWTGQAIAGLASLGGVVLVYTGFALAWRRFFPRKRKLPAAGQPPKEMLRSVA